jgi:alpha-1,6-mannosyltransferase
MHVSTRAELSVLVAGASSVLVLVFALRGPLSVVLMCIGLVASLVAAHAVRSNGAIPRSLWPTVAVLALTAVVAGPISSHDLWSYSFYGRMVSQHGVDPYHSVPAVFPHDVVYPVVGWRHTPSGYGPLFTMFSTLLTWVAGDSLLAMRLGFQLLAAGAVLWCLSVLARARRGAALTLVALQPFIWISLVNGGHNDAIVAAVLLAAVVAFDRNRIVRCGVLVAVAVSIKLTAVFIVVPLVVVLMARRRWKDTVIVAGIPAAGLIACGLFVAGSLGNASSETRGIITRASVWRPVQMLTGLPASTVTMVATGATLALVGWIAWLHIRDSRAPRAAGSALSAFGMVSSYTFPWYLFLGVPALALSGDLVLLAIVSARATLMAASYQLGASAPVATPMGRLSVVSTVLLVGAFIWRVGHRSAGRHIGVSVAIDTEVDQAAVRLVADNHLDPQLTQG